MVEKLIELSIMSGGVLPLMAVLLLVKVTRSRLVSELRSASVRGRGLGPTGTRFVETLNC